MIASLAFAVALQATDPMLLKIGARGTVMAKVDTIVSTRSGRTATVEDIAKAADRKRWVFLGEQHATTAHQQLHADVVRALLDRGRTVVVGLEMITRPMQPVLDRWVQGELTEEDFLAQVDWKKQWGFGYEFYRPIFEVCRLSKTPILALNVPRDWVRSVGRGGYEALTPEQRAELPAEFGLDNQNHRDVFTALMGGHPMTGTQGENIYKAQVLWDEGMADTAIKDRASRPDGDKIVYVVMAGVGHIMYNQGINFRVQKRTRDKGVVVAMGSATEDREVAKGLGDFVYLSAEKKP